MKIPSGENTWNKFISLLEIVRPSISVRWKYFAVDCLLICAKSLENKTTKEDAVNNYSRQMPKNGLHVRRFIVNNAMLSDGRQKHTRSASPLRRRVCLEFARRLHKFHLSNVRNQMHTHIFTRISEVWMDSVVCRSTVDVWRSPPTHSRHEKSFWRCHHKTIARLNDEDVANCLNPSNARHLKRDTVSRRHRRRRKQKIFQMHKTLRRSLTVLSWWRLHYCLMNSLSSALPSCCSLRLASNTCGMQVIDWQTYRFNFVSQWRQTNARTPTENHFVSMMNYSNFQRELNTFNLNWNEL